MPSSSQECRRQSLALIRLAEASASPEDKRRFANLAESWLKLASDLEAIEKHLQTKAGRKKAS